VIGAIVTFLLAATMAAFAIWLFVYADRRERRDEMLLRLRTGDEPSGGVYFTRESRLRNPVLRAACHLIWRTGSDLEPSTVLKILYVLGAMIPLTLLLFGWFWGALVIGSSLAFGFGILRSRALRRRARIVQQLPGFLENAMRVLQAGNTLEESIATAAGESAEPLRPLFQSVSRQVKLGAPLDQVLQEAADIHRIREIKAIALGAAVNRKYGGSLRNVFRSLIGAIRSRESAARELRALTAETRFSAVVMAAIPAGLTAFIYLRNRDYYVDMWASTGGRITLILALVLQILGVIVIYRMLNATEDSG
jgi:tight adherence protein B